MKENLVPVSRPDRNGKIVTRWVRPDDATGKTPLNIPSPGMASTKPQYKEALTVLRPDTDEVTRVTKALKRVSKKMPELLDRVIEASRSDDDVAANINSLIRYFGTVDSDDSYMRLTLERALLVQPYTKKMMALLHPKEDEDWTRDAMFRMEKTIQNMETHLTMREPICKAAIMMSFFHELDSQYNANSRVLWTENEATIHYISQNLEAVEDVALEIYQRKSFSKGAIEELVAAPSKALTSGIL